MKHCPECETYFADSDHFCELDGTRLASVDPDAPQCEIVFPDSDYFCELGGPPLVSVEPDPPECETEFIDSDHFGELDDMLVVSAQPDAQECETDFADSDHSGELDDTPVVSAQPDAPECETDFADSDHFGDPDNISHVSLYPDAPLTSETNLRMVALAVGGVVIGVILFLIYHAMTREPATQGSNTRALNSSVVMQQQPPISTSVPVMVANASPSVEPSPSPSATPTPSPKAERRVELSSTAISTDQKTKSGPVIIRLNDGARIHSDEAWQTREGIWYRKGSVIALLDPKQVKAIEKEVTPAEKGTSADKVTPATPAPSPAQSPSPLRTASQSSSRILTPARRQR